MSILSFFKPTCPIPTAEDTGIGLQATQKANEAVKHVMSEQQAKRPAKKQKIYTTFTNKQRANIGKYAAENGNAACLREYRSEIPDLGESTLRSFKKRCQHTLRDFNTPIFNMVSDLNHLNIMPHKLKLAFVVLLY